MTEYLEMCFKKLREVDPDIESAIIRELARQQQTIELIASENIASEAVMAAIGNVMTNKYAEGYPNSRYYGGCKYVDIAENLAIERAKELFDAESVNVQPHSGAQANAAVYYAMLEPGDTVMGMRLSEGGHLTHGAKVNLSGRFYNFISYGVNKDSGVIDYSEVLDIALKHKPKMIVCGASAYPRKIDFSKFREIADKCGAILMSDMAHIAGLVAVGLHQNPVPYSDFVTTTTHKTLRGTRGGIILCKKEYEYKINKAVFPGTQGGPLMHTIAAKAVCLKEALSKDFKKYIENVILNASVMAEKLMSLGIKLVSGGTDNHLLLIDLKDSEITGLELEKRLESVNITVNKNTVPGEMRAASITSGVRVGTPFITSRGFISEDCEKVAELIYEVYKENNVDNYDLIRGKVQSLTEKHPIYK